MNDNIQNDEILQHHGVLGQRWGVRRTEHQLARGGKSNSSSKKASTKEAEGSKVKSMSDAELRQRINRIQMERQYSQLNKKDISNGQKFITDVFTNAAKQTFGNYVSKYLTKGTEEIFDKVIKPSINKSKNTIAALAVANEINKTVKKM